MAYNMKNFESEEVTSKFNAGLWQMKRIHEIQSNVNLLNSNLLAYNMDSQQWNYYLKIYLLDTLYQEVRPKLKPSDREATDEFRDWLHDFLKKNKVYERKKTLSSKEGTLKLNEHNWEMISDALFKYENLIRDHLEKKNMNSPNDDEDDGL